VISKIRAGPVFESDLLAEAASIFPFVVFLRSLSHHLRERVLFSPFSALASWRMTSFENERWSIFKKPVCFVTLFGCFVHSFVIIFRLVSEICCTSETTFP